MERYVPPMSEEGKETIRRKRLEVWRDQVQLKWLTDVDAAQLSPRYTAVFREAIGSLPEIPAEGLAGRDEKDFAEAFHNHLYQEIAERNLSSALRQVEKEKGTRIKYPLEQEERDAVNLFKQLTRECFNTVPNLIDPVRRNNLLRKYQ